MSVCYFRPSVLDFSCSPRIYLDPRSDYVEWMNDRRVTKCRQATNTNISILLARDGGLK